MFTSFDRFSFVTFVLELCTYIVGYMMSRIVSVCGAHIQNHFRLFCSFVMRFHSVLNESIVKRHPGSCCIYFIEVLNIIRHA